MKTIKVAKITPVSYNRLVQLGYTVVITKGSSVPKSRIDYLKAVKAELKLEKGKVNKVEKVSHVVDVCGVDHLKGE